MLVAFTSFASNLVKGDTNGTLDVFVHERLTGQTTRVNTDSQGHAELVRPVRLNRVIIDLPALLAVISFVLIYIAVFVLGTAVLALDASIHGSHLGVLDLVFASASTLANAGVGLGAAGPQGSFAAFGDVSTLRRPSSSTTMSYRCSSPDAEGPRRPP